MASGQETGEPKDVYYNHQYYYADGTTRQMQKHYHIAGVDNSYGTDVRKNVLGKGFDMHLTYDHFYPLTLGYKWSK